MNIFYHILEAQRDWYKPEWIYESIPWLYTGAGVVTIVWLRSGIGLFSGGLFITAGMIVLSQRYSYRRQKALEQAEKDYENRRFRELGEVVWRPSFNCGHELMDEQHESLFSEANRIIKVIMDDEQELDYDKTLFRLLRDVQRHFRDEEKFLSRMIPDIAPRHKATHQKLSNQIMSFVDRIREEEATQHELLSFLVVDVITKHTLNEDLKWKDMLRSG